MTAQCDACGKPLVDGEPVECGCHVRCYNEAMEEMYQALRQET